MSVLAVIGSAGRQKDSEYVSNYLYDKMLSETKKMIDEFEISKLISGGAAFSDHLAVTAFLKGWVSELELYLPGKFEQRYFGTHDSKTANSYHQKFSEKLNIDSLNEISTAINQGAIVSSYPGFKTRNLEVAYNNDYVLAFTFGYKTIQETDFFNSDEGFSSHSFAGLKDGGTAHTWDQSYRSKMKRHCNLWNLL